MSFSTETSRTYDHSLSVIEMLWMAILATFLIAPMLLWCIRKCQSARQVSPGAAATTSNARAPKTKQEIEARKTYLEHHLKIHKVVTSTIDTNRSEAKDDPEKTTATTTTTTTTPSTADISNITKGDLILPPPAPSSSPSPSVPAADSQDTSEDDASLDAIDMDMDDDDDRPMCAICVNAYKANDNICWSNNCQCHHCFHQECITEWLLLHEECPCCRLPFLVNGVGSKKGTGDEEQGGGDTDVSHAESSLASHDPRTNLRFSTQDEDSFQRMVASLRNSYHSIQSPRAVGEEEMESSKASPSRAENHDTIDASGRTAVMDASGRTQVMVDPETLLKQPNSAENTNADNTAFVDVELGESDESSHGDAAADSTEHSEEHTQHC
ncbi:unnamed protein product [Cylindrotheca closterium]|uniref:RING-type domain-containing protein n=1 Tax=Cylindrotheca closterium TaxID=2856 RepID=A0AAD2PU57_9STRA|nr:unnamed protein product [Cylindrotheca closterium]